ncbi:MAG TPA: redoxin domain-containing protein [Planctomycetota bacterium]|nr:redoxin domain-containing protein [Planctomycetota bacterium]
MRKLSILAALAAFLVPATLRAQETLELKGSGWVNSKELSLDRLKGKVVIVFFFEEQCPRCIASIPARNQLRKNYADKPVVFIAINSGNPKSVIEDYVKSNKFEWPIFIDERRETEKPFGFTISLQNIYQWFMIDPDGKLHRTAFDEKGVAEDIDKHLSEAKMLFDGISVPEKLKPMARDLEFGQYDPGVSELATLAAKGPKDLQPAAEAMYDKLKPMAESGLEKARALEAEGKKYPAYGEYARVASWFRKTDYEKTATTAMAALKKDKEVQDELAAKALLDQAKALLSSSKKGEKEGAAPILAALQKKYPGSEAAREAAKLK